VFENRKEGLYCVPADLFIDPTKKVDKALITHAHADHARSGHKHYVCQERTVPLLQSRLSKKIRVEGKDFGERFEVNGVKFSFHPAGHIIGSAQIRAQYDSKIWVVSGDLVQRI